MTFDDFTMMKKKWLKNLSLQWLIQGHLSQEDALKMVEITEQSLQSKMIAKEDCDMYRLVKFQDKTVYNYDVLHKNPDNPNSCVVSYFEVSYRKDEERNAVARVMYKFLEEPFFNTLRTQEQLGYIVKSFTHNYKTPYTPIWHCFKIQSSVKDAEYCEHRINAFLEDKLQNWEPTDAEVETIKEAIINKIK